MIAWTRHQTHRIVPLAAVLGWLVSTTPGVAQERPILELAMPSPESLYVSVKGLLTDQIFSAMQSGFPLYVEYQIVLRESGGLFDRTVRDDIWLYSMVALYDPVREVLVVEDPGGAVELPSRGALRGWLEKVYLLPTPPPSQRGRYYYEATVNARTLSDSDVDEAFAWLRGESGDSARLRKPGVITRTARRLLVKVAPLPKITLKQKTPEFGRN